MQTIALPAGRRRVGLGAAVAGLLLAGCAAGGGATATRHPASGPAASSGTAGTSAAPTSGSASPKGPAPAALTCADVKQAFLMADMAISGIDDDTASVRTAAEQGTLPYVITLNCRPHLPGYPHPGQVQLDLTPTAAGTVLTAMASGLGGRCSKLPVDQGYGDVGYLCPQAGGGYGLEAAKGRWLLHVGYLRQPEGIEHVARYLLGRL